MTNINQKQEQNPQKNSAEQNDQKAANFDK